VSGFTKKITWSGPNASLLTSTSRRLAFTATGVSELKSCHEGQSPQQKEQLLPHTSQQNTYVVILLPVKMNTV
jgi:hypothetical protein